MAQATAGQLKVGLRFKRSQARLLRHLAARVRNSELPNSHAAIFDAAAQAASTGEPLIVICRNQMEAQMMAAGYTQYGVTAPTIEQVSMA